MSSWMHGVVKAVQSGDTLVIMGTAKTAIPPTKAITLSSLLAPKLGRYGVSPDEEFAWEAREFLRKKVVGKRCVFKIDYTLENIPGREFGTVFVDQENLALSVVQNGFAKVREGAKQSPYMEQLKPALQLAQEQEVGMFAKDTETRRNAVRDLRPGSNEAGFDSAEYYASMGKGAKLQGVVEAVLNGSTLRVYLPQQMRTITVLTCGVVTPSMRKQVDGVSAGPEKYAMESRFYTELKALNRDVKLILEGIDQYGNLFCTVMVQSFDGPEINLGMSLAKDGWANFSQRSAEQMSAGRQELRQAVIDAKSRKANMWKDFVPTDTSVPKEAQNFKAVVVEIVSGDTIVVKNKANNKEVRMSLASLRAPRMRTAGSDVPEPHAIDAKEFLRSRIIGKDVIASLEYTRKVPPPPGQPETAANTQIQFGNIIFNEKQPTGQTEPKQVAEMMVEKGYATVIRGRPDDDQSSIFDQLIDAEKVGQAAKSGVHSNKQSVQPRINDVSQPGTSSKAKQYLPFFSKAAYIQAVVEQVINGHRYRCIIPKESVMIVFSPSGIRTPQRTVPQAKAEPYGDEAYSFVREHIMQRQVEITIETMDRGGTFLGSLIVQKGPKEGGPLNIGVALLENGLARLIDSFSPDRVRGGEVLSRAQGKAMEAKLRIWKDYDPSAEEGEAETEDMPMTNGTQREKKEVMITELQDATSFYVQMSDSSIQKVVEQIKEMKLDETDKGIGGYTKGQMVMAKFTADEEWYRAYVENVQKQGTSSTLYGVYFIDYGNRERLEGDRLRPLKGTISQIPPQAFLCKLAYAFVPEYEEEFGVEAADEFNSYTQGKLLVAQIERRERIGQPYKLSMEFINRSEDRS
eukprot:TRINITY_DN3183_c0_g1_i8.p1 TRINITY_DN3183_c0_g1~~TRINITY_DN3183_c0_g1_i8.p1  ORF type:complete len:856 (+),score=173.66 TRINITY_DN3183_c0_g1_i8:56-2623(+)